MAARSTVDARAKLTLWEVKCFGEPNKVRCARERETFLVLSFRHGSRLIGFLISLLGSLLPWTLTFLSATLGPTIRMGMSRTTAIVTFCARLRLLALFPTPLPPLLSMHREGRITIFGTFCIDNAMLRLLNEEIHEVTGFHPIGGRTTHSGTSLFRRSDRLKRRSVRFG
jgi:hypothetical protein